MLFLHVLEVMNHSVVIFINLGFPLVLCVCAVLQLLPLKQASLYLATFLADFITVSSLGPLAKRQRVEDTTSEDTSTVIQVTC